MAPKLTYAMKFVSDMDEAVAFHRDVLGLTLKFQSPGWSEFVTGDTTLALHNASDKNLPGHVELGFAVADLNALYAARTQNGLDFVEAPHDLHGSLIARIRDREGATYTLSGTP